MSTLKKDFRDRRPDRRGFTVIALIALAVLMVGAGVSHAFLVSGAIKDQEGSPIEGALVTFINQADETQASQITGADGIYQIDLSGLIYPEVSVSEIGASQTPAEFRLFQSYPNPFNPETIVLYQMPEASDVTIVIYNSLGQKVRTLVNAYQAPGLYHVRWDARDDNGSGVGAGVYFYQMVSGNFIQTRKMLLLDGSGSGLTPFVRGFSPSDRSRKPTTLAPLFTIRVTGEGFFDYWRSGVAVVSDMDIDITVNSTQDKGMLRLSLTDAPVDSADAVNVAISSVQIKRNQNGSWETFADEQGGGWVRDLASNVVGSTVDLLSLTGGVTALLGEAVLDPGALTGIRVLLDSAEIVVDGKTYNLTIPSGAQTGLKLLTNFKILAGETLDLTLDFDARKSIVRKGKDKDEYLLKPVLRLVPTSEAGSVSGHVRVEDGVPVKSIDAVIIAMQEGEEISSAKVHPKHGTYRLSCLPAGTYELKAEVKEGVIVDPEILEAEVFAGEETEDQDFTIMVVGGEPEGGEEGEKGEGGSGQAESVQVDIKPGVCPNPLNTKGKGVLLVAILGTEEFDVADVDPFTVQLEGVAPIDWNTEDAGTPVAGEEVCDCTTDGADGYEDLILEFDTKEIVSILGDVEDGEGVPLTLTGELSDDTPIEGQDCIIVESKGKPEDKGNEDKGKGGEGQE